MKTLLFILFFPITVPTYLFCKFTIWFFQWIGESFIPFLLNSVFPTAKKLIKKLSAKIKDAAEKHRQEREKKKADQDSESKKASKKKPVQHITETAGAPEIQTVIKSIEQEQPTENTIESTLNISVPVNTSSSSSDIDTNLEKRVFLLFYSVSTSKKHLRDCTTPSVFFKNYEDAVNCLKTLAIMEENNSYPFYEPFPSEQLKELQNSQYYVDLVNDFIKRHWYKVLNEASKYKTDEAIKRKIDSFKSNFDPFIEYIPNKCQEFIEQLSSTELDIHNLPESQKKKIDFDKETEKNLLSALENQTDAYGEHCCYSFLIDFYFKYRNDYPKAVWECIKYCHKDIEAIPEIQQAYIENEIQRITWLYEHDKEELETKITKIRERSFNSFRNSFDRITMLYFYEKDYESAIQYCKLAIEHGQDHDLKYTKRIERFKKKRAAEEKKLYGTELSHND